jgi:hypothetical protein
VSVDVDERPGMGTLVHAYPYRRQLPRT